MFSDAVIYQAAHVVYCSVFADEAEERGGGFPGSQDICRCVPALTPAEHDPIIRPLLAKIDRDLGTPLDRIFVAGEIISEETQIDALGDLLLGVQGHGVCILDNYADQWERGCVACKSDGKLPYDDMDCYRDIAAEKLATSGYDSEPIIETAFHWHGGQESALYAFASTREVQSEEHRVAVLEEIGACLKHAESHEADKLRRLEAVVKSARIGDTFVYL